LRAELKDLQMNQRRPSVPSPTINRGDVDGRQDRHLNNGRLIPGQHSERDQFAARLPVAAFVGSPAMNLLPGEVVDGKIVVPGAFDHPLDETGRKRLATGAGAVTIGIRSEDIAVGPAGAAAARVHHVENHGVEKIVTLRTGDVLFKATVPAVSPIAVEETVRFSLNQNKLRLRPRLGRNRIGLAYLPRGALNEDCREIGFCTLCGRQPLPPSAKILKDLKDRLRRRQDPVFPASRDRQPGACSTTSALGTSITVIPTSREQVA
jgi:hypothetical protein